jgi:endonuclease G
MKKLLVVLLFVPLSALAQLAKECPQFLANGTPLYPAKFGDQEICHLNYAIIHKCEVKQAIAVFEHLTPAKITGGHKRRDDFRPDPRVFPECAAQLRDYAGQPYDRGHMSPAGNNTQSAEIMSESFYLSNMVPQNPNNNRGIWKQLETWERDWAMKGGDFYIISGPVFMPNYRVIGNGVGVPDYLYKIIVERTSGQVMAYLIPNAPLPVSDLPKYQTTISAVESATGIQFNLGK